MFEPYQLGDPQFLVAFLFVLATVFGVLRVSGIFKNPAVDMIISLSIAFFASTYPPFTSLLLSYLPGLTWFFIGMFLLIFIIEVFGLRKAGSDYETKAYTAAFVLLALAAVGFSRIETLRMELPFIGSGENLSLLLGLLFVFLIFYYVYRSDSGQRH